LFLVDGDGVKDLINWGTWGVWDSLEFVGAELLVDNLPDNFVRHDGQELTRTVSDKIQAYAKILMPKKKKVGLPPTGFGLVLSDFFCLEAQAPRQP
jgi:hypothetical protein